ncbi:unnamed protein product [Vitrella brassicaformis CCMP3155]|uniref:Uncharacterized protein n=1 Tax=Vitrella brassicaformis (strain CCMP3155) TaxID=1169540 RepID=A0A0G4GED1_VITBC|nr:unnamed protein product [Vitrella brassicaformis CCMP3155]|mmetsp:Transcript_716/g.1514  ORF Transcript_716/g.1514 Transcript_716/m.1514 type:complete len:219 (-) Transcript_716:206-862(-)|eukprot:CEM27481.1 unnamed protein product [Vitrella brassicaformis CCMP3155]
MWKDAQYRPTRLGGKIHRKVAFWQKVESTYWNPLLLFINLPIYGVFYWLAPWARPFELPGDAGEERPGEHRVTVGCIKKIYRQKYRNRKDYIFQIISPESFWYENPVVAFRGKLPFIAWTVLLKPQFEAELVDWYVKTYQKAIVIHCKFRYTHRRLTWWTFELPNTIYCQLDANGLVTRWLEQWHGLQLLFLTWLVPVHKWIIFGFPITTAAVWFNRF